MNPRPEPGTSRTADIHVILSPDAVLAGFEATSKKQLLQDLAEEASERIGLDARDIFEQLLQRERLGSTGMGSGVAVPHARTNGVSRIFGLFAQLVRSVDFEAPDDIPVDLVFLLLAPKESGADHLKALARISRLMRDEDVRQELRGASSAEAVYAILTEDRGNRNGH